MKLSELKSEIQFNYAAPGADKTTQEWVLDLIQRVEGLSEAVKNMNMEWMDQVSAEFYPQTKEQRSKLAHEALAQFGADVELKG